MRSSAKTNIKIPTLFAVLASALLLHGCITSNGPSGKRARIKDFSIVKDFTGCSESYLVLSSPNACVTECGEGTHLASAEELTEVKQELLANQADDLLTLVNNSKYICVDDTITEKRPNLQIEIKNDFCSCINGKSDTISDCDSICATKPFTDQPTLYVNTVMGAEIFMNEKLKNLHNWCTVQLASDDKKPQCTLSATDGASTVNIPIATSQDSNSFTADVKLLSPDRTYILKVLEFGSGSNAQSKEFQIRRKKQTTADESTGALKVSHITQYSCITYGGTLNSAGVIKRAGDTFAKYYYYFPANETPAPMPPVAGGNESLVVCHDEQKYAGNDSIEYPRLEQIPLAFSLWDKADSRFAKRTEYGGKMGITKAIEDRLLSEFPNSGIVAADLFRALTYPNRPSLPSSSSTNNQAVQGYIMIPFTDAVTRKSYCPSAEQLNGTQPLLSILQEYMPDTEGLFLSEKEGELVFNNGTYTTTYGTMFVPENIIKNYGFYIENGLKIRVTEASMSTKTIHFYWPVSQSADPLAAGGRKLFTVRSWDTLAGQTPSTPPTAEQTTDKRIGCIPKSQ